MKSKGVQFHRNMKKGFDSDVYFMIITLFLYASFRV